MILYDFKTKATQHATQPIKHIVKMTCGPHSSCSSEKGPEGDTFLQAQML